MRVNVRVDIEGALEKFKLSAEDAKSAIPRALNKTATTARANAAREIRDTGYNIKVGDSKNAIRIRKATRSELNAALVASGRPIPLINYGATQTKTGVAVRVLKGRTTIKGAFIATMRNGHRGVFIRIADAKALKSLAGRAARKLGIHKKGHGLPIQQLFGPSIPTAFENEIVQRAVVDAINERFPTVLAQELRYITMKQKR